MNLSKLLIECRANNLKAQYCLYDLYAERMFALCRRYLNITEDAEDALMIGFQKFFAYLPNLKYADDQAAVAWLRRIMVNECLKQLRAKRSFLILVGSELSEVETEEDIMSCISEKEIYELIMQLPVNLRTIFNLSVLEKLSHLEIAGMLGITELASRLQLNRAKAMLRTMLIKNSKDYEARK
jgi:RNA polymerase sigma factor (sigma-70 family)